MTIDKELLESAAKAAGLVHLTYCEAWNCMAVYNPAGYFEWDTYWNSARNSYHALDLITRLKLSVMCHSDNRITISNSTGTITVADNPGCEESKVQAALLAITKVASAIGESL